MLLTPLIWSPLNRSLLNGVLFGPVQYKAGAAGWDCKSVYGIAPKDIYLTAGDGNKIHGWFLRNPKSTYTVLLSHGLAGNLTNGTDLMALFIKSGASVFAYDYEGYGRSEGSPSVDVCCNDARAAYNYLVTDQKIDPLKIVLFGESFGTGVTANLSRSAESAGIILQCPFLSLRHRAIELFAVEAIYPQSFYPENALDNGAVLASKHAPLLIIGGVDDPILPIKHADQLAAMALEPKSYIRIERAGHSGDPRLVNSPKYLAGLKTFFASIANRPAIAISKN